MELISLDNSTNMMLAIASRNQVIMKSVPYHCVHGYLLLVDLVTQIHSWIVQ